MVFIKTAAALGDMLSYNRDVGVMSAFPDTTVQLKDAMSIFNALGYKMKWYRAAKCTASVSWNPNSDQNKTGFLSGMGVMPRYTTFTSSNTSIPYTYIGEEVEIPSSNEEGMVPTEVTLYQGTAITPNLLDSYCCPTSVLDPWHSVYSYNLSISDLTSSYSVTLSNINIAEKTLCIIDDQGYEWTETDSIAKAETGRYFEVSINNSGYPVITFSCNPEVFEASKFKVFYLITSGKDGRISSNTLDSKPITQIYIRSNDTLTDISNLIVLTNESSSGGYNYETAEEARKNFAKMKGTSETLVTASDFENTIKSIEGISNVKCFDSNSTDFVFRVEENIANSTGIFVSVDGCTTSGEPCIYIPDNCELWIPSLRVYVNGDLLGSCGGRKTSDNKYYFYVYPETEATAHLSVNYTYFDDNAKLFHLSVTGMQEGDLLWCEYRCYVNGNNLLVRPLISDDYLFEDIVEEIQSEISSKKHISLETTIIDDTSTITHWEPEGEINLNKQISLSESSNIMSSIYNSLDAEYNILNNDYNDRIEYGELENCIIDSNSLIKNVKLENINYYLLTDNGKKISYSKIKNNTITGKILYQITGTFNYNASTTIQFNLPDNMNVIPNTFFINIGYGAYIIRDSKVRYERTGYIDSQNVGTLYCDRGFVSASESHIYYDGSGSDSVKQITLTIPAQTTFAGEQTLIVGFETSCNNILNFQGYDPSTFYINHRNIKEYTLGLQ